MEAEQLSHRLSSLLASENGGLGEPNLISFPINPWQNKEIYDNLGIVFSNDIAVSPTVNKLDKSS